MKDFNLIQGTTKILNCTISNSDNSLLDLDDITDIKFGARYYGDSSGAPVILKTLSEGIQKLGLGVIEIKLSPNDTINISGKLQYEVRITDLNDNVFVPISGCFVVNNKSI